MTSRRLSFLKFICPAVAFLTVGELSEVARAQTPANSPFVAHLLPGYYDVYAADHPQIRVTSFKVQLNVQGFTIFDVAQGWEGKGMTSGQSGFYDWRFADGRTGRTTFVVNPDGSLQGRAVGSGIDFSFLARPSGSVAGPSSAPAAKRVPAAPIPADKCFYKGKLYPATNRQAVCHEGHISDCLGSGMFPATGGWVSTILTCRPEFDGRIIGPGNQ